MGAINAAWSGSARRAAEAGTLSRSSRVRPQFGIRAPGQAEPPASSLRRGSMATMTRTAIATGDYGHRHIVRTVVVAEADDDMLDLLLIVLEGMDIACHRAEDGEHAVVLCREHKPQVLLLATRVHGMTAPAVCRAIREDPSLEGVRIILRRAMADQSVLDEALTAGAETYVIPPVGPIELLEVFSGRQNGP